MTPQSVPVLHYTKQPLLEPNRYAAVLSSCGRPRRAGRAAKDRRIKCVIVGDKAVGKTSLAVSYSNDCFPSEYVPTAYDNYNVEVQVNGKPVRVELCDTTGEDELNPLRNLCYPGADVFMLCFSVVKPSSFISACTRWADELARHAVPVVLVGTQADLACNQEALGRLKRSGQRPVSPAEARGLAERLDAPYVETSALACTQLKEAFDTAILVALRRQERTGNRWRRLFCCLG
ncbi:unnamed protein product [Phyllotreta striolata]|uniref:Uncharacterized protein n=1 Tax=Phyllotreta striolata TaxID=444603 RepID=A0A9N9U046_PHYSR|nr:unnamed protein product [Phyllotreta striolata]